MSTKLNYKSAGVDIDAGEALVDRIKPAAKSTARPGADAALGGFGGYFDLKAAGYKDPVLVAATDGVGTKLKIAIETGIHRTVGIDLVAMCVNDLTVQGAEPLFFLDYFASGKLEVDMAQAVIEGIAQGCRIAGCALIGGETAEMPGMYAKGDYDIAGFAVGAVERQYMLDPHSVIEGDVVLGLASNGVHSNGFSLVRKIVEHSGLSYGDTAPFQPDHTLGEALLAPTRIYGPTLCTPLQPQPFKALAHITGGGLLENIPRALPHNLSVQLDAAAWPFPPVFRWLQQQGSISMEDMARTFNCGIGMVVICAAAAATNLCYKLQEAGETVFPIGTVVSSDTQDRSVIIKNMEKAWTE